MMFYLSKNIETRMKNYMYLQLKCLLLIKYFKKTAQKS